ncbi:MAG: TonB family protein [Devosia sp.]|jgi:protein TonB|uniref:energy transducer TonB family protein n=1 Tax=unclassified Devosia TaxID=196773 RepID=UPI0019F6A9A9|nr:MULTISPECIES: energy transducer TonB [unclassified Devosia]MBF0678692.1 TonB family protein [Devosia sp.]WEJ31739.1 TonB family protein [Devosia sp. SD17-2]
MHYALPGSALVHAGMIGLFLIGFNWSDVDDAPAPTPVSVSIVALSTVATNSTQVLQSDATVTAVSAGSSVQSLEPLASEIIDPVEAQIEPLQIEQIEPVDPTPPEVPVQAEPMEALEPPQRVELTSDSTDALEAMSSTVEPLQTASIEPISVDDLKVAPVPQTLSFERPSKPTPRPAAQPPKTRAPGQAGNGGQSQADSVAAAGAPATASGNGSGGQAEVARYPSVVISELRRALRRTGSNRGEVVVRFTVNASGQLANVSIARSSGNSAVDQAGITTVQRAAPFPPIPSGAGRNSWTFDVPLAFGG